MEVILIDEPLESFYLLSHASRQIGTNIVISFFERFYFSYCKMKKLKTRVIKSLMEEEIPSGAK